MVTSAKLAAWACFLVKSDKAEELLERHELDPLAVLNLDRKISVGEEFERNGRKSLNFCFVSRGQHRLNLRKQIRKIKITAAFMSRL